MKKLEKVKFENFEIYEEDSKKNEIYYNFLCNKIVYSTAAKETLSEKEFRAVIYHERDHQKKRFIFFIFLGLITIFIFFKNFILAFLLIILMFILRRREEYMADEFSIRNGNQIETLFSARKKVMKEEKKILRKILYCMTHPSEKKRIARLEKRFNP